MDQKPCAQPKITNHKRLTRDWLLAWGETSPWPWVLSLLGVLLVLGLLLLAVVKLKNKGPLFILGAMLSGLVFNLIAVAGRHLERWRLARAVLRGDYFITEDLLVKAEEKPTRNLSEYSLSFRRGDTGEIEKQLVSEERFAKSFVGERYYCVRRGERLLGEFAASDWELDEELAGRLRASVQNAEGKNKDGRSI